MLYTGGMEAAKGTYWSMETGERIDVDGIATLPGGRNDRYLKAHGAVALMAGPVLGLVYAIFLPLIGIVMTFSMVWEKTAEVAADMAASSINFGWRPVESYLTGRRKRKEARRKKEQSKKGR